MNGATLTATTFTLSSGDPAVLVPGSVTYYERSKAVFWANSNLEPNTEYTATITTGPQSASGTPLAEDYEWSFTTGDEERTGHPV